MTAVLLLLLLRETREKKKGGGRQCALVLLFSQFFFSLLYTSFSSFFFLLLELLLPRYLRYNTWGRRQNVVKRLAIFNWPFFPVFLSFTGPYNTLLTFSSSFLHIFPFIFLTKLEEFLFSLRIFPLL